MTSRRIGEGVRGVLEDARVPYVTGSIDVLVEEACSTGGYRAILISGLKTTAASEKGAVLRLAHALESLAQKLRDAAERTPP